LVFRKGDENIAAFNEGLKAIKADGSLDALIAKYWGAR
ncbi:basic amino acid ABC transporter substrate-binding protein, partial [Mesorhizobium sp. M2D.F.Ca.ET.145.01.1.1]